MQADGEERDKERREKLYFLAAGEPAIIARQKKLIGSKFT
jgi:hypothetical protein